MKIRKRLAAVAAAACLMVGGGVVVASPAFAGNCTSVLGIKFCGKVTNYSSSKCTVRISNGWPQNYGTIHYLYPGQSSTRFYADTDAVYVPSSCFGAYPPVERNKWVKINDLTHIKVQGF